MYMYILHNNLPVDFLRSCFSFFIFDILFLSLRLPLCFRLFLFLFSLSCIRAFDEIFLSIDLPIIDDLTFCNSAMKSLFPLLPGSNEVPFPFVRPDRSSFRNDFAHGWFVSIGERVLKLTGTKSVRCQFHVEASETAENERRGALCNFC